jgi:hypothetical protein
MIEGREYFSLSLKACKPVVVSRERGRYDLDGDLTLQPCVGGAPHLPHPTFADLSGDFVNAEASARVKGQTVVDYMSRLVTRTGLLLGGG